MPEVEENDDQQPSKGDNEKSIKLASLFRKAQEDYRGHMIVNEIDRELEVYQKAAATSPHDQLKKRHLSPGGMHNSRRMDPKSFAHQPIRGIGQSMLSAVAKSKNRMASITDSAPYQISSAKPGETGPKTALLSTSFLTNTNSRFSGVQPFQITGLQL